MSPIMLPPVLIAVCGATGTGKSSFINDAAGTDNMSVGHSQMSCTENVKFAPSFELDGHEVWLIDTPGFDDSSVEDSEILGRIGAFLEQTFEQGQLLSGIVYMHRITDNRLGGMSRRNFRVFRELCGTRTLTNVIIATNMWHDPPEPIELQREEELMQHEMFFQPAIAKGARSARYIRQQAESAHNIIRMCIPNTPLPTRYQEEIHAGASVGETSAGRVLNEELQRLVDKQRLEIEALKREFQDALRARDEEARQELEEERRRSEARFAALMHDIENLNSELDKQREERRKDRAEFEDQQRELRQQIKVLMAEIAELQFKLDGETDPDEIARIRKKIQDRQEKVKEKRRSLLENIADYCAGIWKAVRSWWS